MEKMTLGIIHALKNSELDWYPTLVNYMTEYSGSPASSYDEHRLNTILKLAYVDFIKTCDRPDLRVSDLLTFIKNDGSRSLGLILSMCLSLAQVYDEDTGEYVNGFGPDYEEFNKVLTPNEKSEG